MSQFHFQCVSHSLISVCLTLSHIHEGSHPLTLNTLTYEPDLQSPHLPRISRGLAYLKQTQFILRISWISCVSDTIHYQNFLRICNKHNSFSGFHGRDRVVEILFHFVGVLLICFKHNFLSGFYPQEIYCTQSCPPSFLFFSGRPFARPSALLCNWN